MKYPHRTLPALETTIFPREYKLLVTVARSEVIRIDDISDFVAEQRNNLHKKFDQLTTPEERVYIPDNLPDLTNIGITQ